MFREYAPIFDEMVKLDEINALTFRDLMLVLPHQSGLLFELKNAVASTSRLALLIEKLKEEHLETKIRETLLTASLKLDSEPANEVLTEVQNKIQDLSTTDGEDLHDPKRDVEQFFEWVDEVIADPSKALGMMTGLAELDGITKGFKRTDFIVVGARTSIGKSAFIIEMALRLTKNGYKVAIYSLEMSKRQLYTRMMANLMTLDAEDFQTGRIPPHRREEMEHHKAFLSQIYVDDTRAVSADYITDSMRRLKRMQGLDVVIVDYLQDVKEQGETNDNGGSALARVCRKLRKGAQEQDCALFGLSQVTRAVEERKDKRPLASDLAGSTGIETSADVIAMLYRDDYYDPNTENKGVFEVNFVKHRNGKVGRVDLYYAKQYQQLRSLSTGRWGAVR